MLKKKTYIPQINCNDCIRRKNCTSLCEAGQKFVSQDYVPLRERLVSNPYLFINRAITIGTVDPVKYLSKKALVVATLLSAGIPRKIIRQVLNISSSHLSVIIKQLKIRFEENIE